MVAPINDLLERFGDLENEALLKAAVNEFDGKPCQLSAFNPEDVVITRWLMAIDSTIPVIFLDTEKHFPETLRYVEQLRKKLKIQNLVTLKPDTDLVKNIDADGKLWMTQVNRCCWLRKVKPLETELDKQSYNILITGRRIEQTPERTCMPAIEEDEQARIKINPMRNWSRIQRDSHMEENNLPHHPLYHLGYGSVSCAPCTTPVFFGENERDGRWRHTKLLADGEGKKNECGLHFAQNRDVSTSNQTLA